jgi:hypothetical protein
MDARRTCPTSGLPPAVHGSGGLTPKPVSANLYYIAGTRLRLLLLLFSLSPFNLATFDRPRPDRRLDQRERITHHHVFPGQHLL